MTIHLREDQMLPVSVQGYDAKLNPAVAPPLRSSRPEIAELKDGYLIPTGRAFGIVRIYCGRKYRRVEVIAKETK